MKQALEGIAAQRRSLLAERREAEASIVAIDKKLNTLGAAEDLLRPKPPASKAPAKRAKRPAAKRRAARKPKARKVDDAYIGGGPVTTRLTQVASQMEDTLRMHGNGGMSERALGTSVGLTGRGAHNTRAAAIRLLTGDGKIVKGETSEDGTPTLTLTQA